MLCESFIVNTPNFCKCAKLIGVRWFALYFKCLVRQFCVKFMIDKKDGSLVLVDLKI